MAVAGDRRRVRIRRARDPRHEAGHAAAGVPALHERGRPRVVHGRRHQHAGGAGERRGDDSESRSRRAAVRGTHARARSRSRQARASRCVSTRSATRTGTRARADDRDARRRNRRVRDHRSRDGRDRDRDDRRVRRHDVATAIERSALPPGVLARRRRPDRRLVVHGARRSDRERAVPRRVSVRVRRAEGLARAGARARVRSERRVRAGWSESRRAAHRGRARARRALPAFSVPTAGSRSGPGSAGVQRLPDRVHPPRHAGRRHAARRRSIGASIDRGLSYLQNQLREQPPQVQSVAGVGRDAGVCGEGAGGVRPQHARGSHAARRAGRATADLRGVLPGRRATRPRTIVAPRYQDLVRRLANARARRAPIAPSSRKSTIRRATGCGTRTRARPRWCSTASRGAATATRSWRRSRAGCSPCARTADGGRRTRTGWRSKRSSATTARWKRTCPT